MSFWLKHAKRGVNVRIWKLMKSERRGGSVASQVQQVQLVLHGDDGCMGIIAWCQASLTRDQLVIMTASRF